jgi:stress response protein YsnF
VPVYEEQLVVSKRLILKERIRIKRRARTEVRVFEDTLKRERLEVTQPKDTILVRETFDASNGNGAPRRH